jgi:cobalt-precorrin 5A hydrolase
MSARYAIGVGARRGVDAEELAALVSRVAAELRVDRALASLAALEGHPDLRAFDDVAKRLDVALVLVAPALLPARAADVLTRSVRVEQAFGVGSVAEALALAAAGEGGFLLAPRAATRRLTCAIARAGEGARAKCAQRAAPMG